MCKRDKGASGERDDKHLCITGGVIPGRARSKSGVPREESLVVSGSLKKQVVDHLGLDLAESDALRVGSCRTLRLTGLLSDLNTG